MQLSQAKKSNCVFKKELSVYQKVTWHDKDMQQVTRHRQGTSLQYMTRRWVDIKRIVIQKSASGTKAVAFPVRISRKWTHQSVDHSLICDPLFCLVSKRPGIVSQFVTSLFTKGTAKLQLENDCNLCLRRQTNESDSTHMFGVTLHHHAMNASYSRLLVHTRALRECQFRFFLLLSHMFSI